MKLLKGFKGKNSLVHGTVATIGNFDGVHLGHQALFTELKQVASLKNLPSLVILFEPQPGEFFLGKEAPARLSTLREKLGVLKNFEIDYVVCLRFDKSLAEMPAVEFANNLLFNALGIKFLLVGQDFCFGSKRLGNVHLLQTLGKEKNIDIEAFPDFSFHGERVSSTKIRKILALGNLKEAENLLGRPYSMCGRVIRGKGLGRQWGIPTANLHIRQNALPLKGVFSIRVKRADGKQLKGVANLGKRPTIGGVKNLLEVHIFDFNDSIYGEMLQVDFLDKIRDEIKFDCVEDLIKQIKADIAWAKEKHLAYDHL